MAFSTRISGSPFFRCSMNHFSNCAISVLTSAEASRPCSGTIFTSTMNASVVIREATVTDAETIAQFEQELFSENWLSESTIANELERGPQFVAYMEGVPVGYAVTHYRQGIVDLLRLGVRNDAQGSGVGRALLRRVLHIPCYMTVLTVHKENKRAMTLYVAEGFVLYGHTQDSYVLTRNAWPPTPHRSHCT
jgi:GNAT superfamily N-acetyltransferase